MSIVVIPDSGCDLPETYLAQHPIKLLPLNISLNGKVFSDNISELERLSFYESGTIDKDQNAETLPSTPDQIYQFFLDDIAQNYDFAIAQSISKVRSPTHENIMSAARLIQRDYHKYRNDAGRSGSFGMRIINSGTVFCGQGILAVYTVNLIQAGVARNQIRNKIEEFKPYIRMFAIPKDVDYLRKRARKKGDKSIGLIAAVVGKTLDISPILRGYGDVTEAVAKIKGRDIAIEKLFNYGIDRLNEGLKLPYIIVSIAGSPKELEKFDSFRALRKLAESNKVELMTTVMNLSGGINMGPGTISLGLASENETLEF